MDSVQELINSIRPLNADAMDAARRWQERLAKPPGSLGKLEDAAVRLSGITGKLKNEIRRCRVIVLAADNGIVEEGIGSAPRTVTAAQAANMTRYLTGMSSMAHAFGDEVQVVDVGIADEYDAPEVLDRKIRRGTSNFYHEPAMTREEAERAILIGAEQAAQAAREGVSVIGVGEMGIGNTTTAAAVACVLLGQRAETMAGRGAGLSDAGLARKIDAIRRGIERNKPDAADVLGVLSKVGGFDIAGMCGVYLGGALYGVPVLIDGFISAVAALCALRLCPRALKAMLASHVSAEPAGRLVLDALGKTPLIAAGMRLGEGTGAVAAMPLLDMALAVYRECYTFKDSGIEAYTPQEGQP